MPRRWQAGPGRLPAVRGRRILPRAFAEQYGVSSDVEARVHEKELADDAVPVQDSRTVPAWFWGPVGRVLVEQRAPGAVDQDPADEVARFLAGAAQELLFSQYQA